MSWDTHSLFAYANVTSVVSQSGTTLVIGITTGSGALFTTGQQVILAPAQTLATLANAMVGRITAIATDQLTIDYGISNREGSNVQTISTSYVIGNGVTPKVLTDIEAKVDTNTASITTALAKTLKSATTSVDVSAATAPSANQVLTATDSTHATWQTPTTPASINFASSGVQADFSTSSTTVVDVTGATVTINPTGTATVHAVVSGRGYDSATSGDLVHIQLLIDGTVIQEYDFKPAATLAGMPFCLSGQKSVAAGARIIKLRAYNGTGARQIDIDQANINVIWS